MLGVSLHFYKSILGMPPLLLSGPTRHRVAIVNFSDFIQNVGGVENDLTNFLRGNILSKVNKNERKEAMSILVGNTVLLLRRKN